MNTGKHLDKNVYRGKTFRSFIVTKKYDSLNQSVLNKMCTFSQTQ